MGDTDVFTNIEKDLQRLLEMKKLWKGKLTLEITPEIRNTLSRCRHYGVLGYTVHSDSIKTFVSKEGKPKRLEKRIKNNNLFDKYIITPIEHSQLFKAFIEVSPGSRLHPNSIERFGTIGMFCRTTDKNYRNDTKVCVTGAHVISRFEIAHTSTQDHGMIFLGKCIWPQRPPNYHVNVRDISLIELDKDIIIKDILNEDLHLFQNRKREDLSERKVFKYGARTGRTVGYVINTSFVLEIGDPTDVILIQHEDEDEEFSKQGDSGAVILTKFGRDLVAFAIIFGGVENIPDLPKNATIGVDLSDAVTAFQRQTGKTIKFDKF